MVRDSTAELFEVDVFMLRDAAKKFLGSGLAPPAVRARVRELQEESSGVHAAPRRRRRRNSDGLTELQRRVAERTLGLGPTCRLDPESAAMVLGMGLKGVKKLRTTAIRILGLKPADFDAPESFKPERTQPERPAKLGPTGERRAGRQWEVGWENAYFTAVAFADPTMSKAVLTVVDILSDYRLFPNHMVDTLRGWNRKTLPERMKMIQSARRKVQGWRASYQKRTEAAPAREHECLFCAGIPDRRPIPGVCPVCDKPGARDLIEPPAIMGSSGGLLIDEHG